VGLYFCSSARWLSITLDNLSKLGEVSSFNLVQLQTFICKIEEQFNPLIPTLKQQNNGPLHSNTVIGTLAVDGWAVAFGTARRGLGGLCTNFILFDVAL